MNLTDLERELDAACGGNSLPRCKFQGNWPEPCAVCIVCQNAHDLLRDCHNLLASYSEAHTGGIFNQRMNDAWHRKRFELLDRISEAVKP